MMYRDLIKVATKLALMMLIMVVISSLGKMAYSQKLLTTSNAAYLDKMERLSAISGQKAIFIGGSATYFGIQVEEFQKMTGIESVNMGLNAGVAFHLYIDSILPYVKENDMVFLTPEYSYYVRDYDKIELADIDMYLCFNKSLLHQINLHNIFPFVANVVSSGLQDWSNLLNETIRDVVLHEAYGVYYRKNANEYGDFVGHKGLPSKEFRSLMLEHKPSSFVVRLNSDIVKLENKGAQVFYLFPPYEINEYNRDENFINEIYNEIKTQTSAKILLKPENSVYPREFFFDSVYHLTWDKAKEYTLMIIKQIV